MNKKIQKQNILAPRTLKHIFNPAGIKDMERGRKLICVLILPKGD